MIVTLETAPAKFSDSGHPDFGELPGASKSGALNAKLFEEHFELELKPQIEGELVCGAIDGLDDVGAEQWLSEADVKLLGEAEGDGAGRSVASAGDVNNDGYDDILIGASGDDTNASNAGATYLIYGSAEGIESMSLADADVKMTGVALGDLSGYSVSGAGDVNNDGYDDIIIGAWVVEDAKLGTEVGATYVVMGSADPLTDIRLDDADAILMGEERGDRSARIISGADNIRTSFKVSIRHGV